MLPIVDLAVEGGYVDFGKPSQDVGGQRAELKLHGAYAAGLLIFPLGPIDLYGKGGVIEAKTESSVGGSEHQPLQFEWLLRRRRRPARLEDRPARRIRALPDQGCRPRACSASALFQF